MSYHCSDKDMQHPRKTGFTLIEISIVLIIIGLVLSGILAGRDLIRAAQIRSTVAQLTEYETAALTFKQKYNCTPGDCEEAESLGFTGGCSNLDSASVKICGNGAVGGEILYSPSAEKFYQEGLDFWAQLSEAKMIKGSYPGFDATAAAVTATPGIAVPALKLNDAAGLWVQSMGDIHTNNRAANAFWTHPSIVVAVYASSLGTLLPIDNYQIDQKLDDGLPITGKVRLGSVVASNFMLAEVGGYEFGAAGASSNFCATTDSPPQYNVKNTTPHWSYPGHTVTTQCPIAYITGF